MNKNRFSIPKSYNERNSRTDKEKATHSPVPNHMRVSVISFGSRSSTSTAENVIGLHTHKNVHRKRRTRVYPHTQSINTAFLHMLSGFRRFTTIHLHVSSNTDYKWDFFISVSHIYSRTLIQRTCCVSLNSINFSDFTPTSFWCCYSKNTLLSQN